MYIKKKKKKYPVEQFKIKIIIPTSDRECVTRLIQYSHKTSVFFFQITFNRYISDSVKRRNSTSVIYI